MFCTNCGNKLPEGSKFCPNCGAKINIDAETAAVQDTASIPVPVPQEITETAGYYAEVVQDAAEEAVTASETAEEIAGAAEEAEETAVETVEETVAEATDAVEDEIAETADEAAQTVDEAVDTAEEAFGAAADAVADTVDDTVDAVEEAVEDTADAVEEVFDTAEETVAEAAESVSDAAEDLADGVSDAAEDVIDDAADTVEKAVGIVEETVEETVSVTEDIAETASDAAGEAAAAVSGVFGEISDTAEEVTRSAEETAESVSQTAENAFTPVAAAVDNATNPYTVQTVPADAGKAAPKKKKKGLTAVIALLLIAALGVGAYFVYQNLPAQKIKRYKQAAIEAVTANDYSEAAVQYKNVLEIDPEDQEAWDALNIMYSSVRANALTDSDIGMYEDAIASMKQAIEIYPYNEDANEADLKSIYYKWAGDLAYQGKDAEAQEIIKRAEADGLSESSLTEIAEYMDNRSTMHALEADLDELSQKVVSLRNDNGNAEIFDALKGQADDLFTYFETYEGGYPYVYMFNNGSDAVIWKASSAKDNAQVYIGPVNDRQEPHGTADIYYISGVTGSSSYEYVRCDWVEGIATGNFTEYNFSFDEESEERYRITSIVSGKVVSGKYDGDITNNRNGIIYNMKFNSGKVQVLDTVDPNGDTTNVVGYTEDRNRWITFSDSALSGSYGIRYIA